MPSFRCKIKKLRFQGILTDKETERILDALDKAENTAEWKEISPAGIYGCTNCSQNVMTSDICVYKHYHGCGAKMRVEE